VPYALTVSDLLTIGEVARRSGVASSALRFYEERGLISSERAGSGHRRYPRPVLRRIAFIVFAQRIGLTLEEIGAEVAKHPPHHSPTRPAATGRGARPRGRRGSTTASPSSSASSSGSPSAPAAAASRSTAAGPATPATAPPLSVPARATGSATGRRADTRTSSNTAMRASLSARRGDGAHSGARPS